MNPKEIEIVISTVQVAITKVANLPSAANVLARLQNDAGISELDALVLLQDCFQEGGTEKIAHALADDVRFLTKWQNTQGKVSVLHELSELALNYRLAKVKAISNISLSNEDDGKRLGKFFRPLMIFVDGEYRGFSLAIMGPTVPGATCSYSISLESHLLGNPKIKTGLIQQISFNHFERSVSGWAMFSSLRCVPCPEVLRQVTQLDISLIQGSRDESVFSIGTCTEKFTCVLQPGDVSRLVRWAYAVASGVDRCTALLWQRCQMEVTARYLAPGWIRLMVRSAREFERYDLSAVVSVHDLISQMSNAFDGLAQASSQYMGRKDRSSHVSDHGESLDRMNWPVVAAEEHWRNHESEIEG